MKTSEILRRPADKRASEPARHGGRSADGEQEPGAEQEPRQDVASEMVGAEPVQRSRWSEAEADIARRGWWGARMRAKTAASTRKTSWMPPKTKGRLASSRRHSAGRARSRGSITPRARGDRRRRHGERNQVDQSLHAGEEEEAALDDWEVARQDRAHDQAAESRIDNTCSMTRLPPSRTPVTMPITLTIGTSPFGSTCPRMTQARDTPSPPRRERRPHREHRASESAWCARLSHLGQPAREAWPI